MENATLGLRTRDEHMIKAAHPTGGASAEGHPAFLIIRSNGGADGALLGAPLSHRSLE